MKTFFYLISSMLFSFVLTGQITDPIPERIEPSNLTFKLKEFVQIPPSSDEIPLARINMLRETPDGSGRLFVNDMRGQLWVLMDGQPGLYLDVSAEFDGFIDEPGLGSGFGCFAFHPEFKTNGLFYTSHTESAGVKAADFSPKKDEGIVLQWVITEWVTADVSSNTFSGINRELIRFDYPGKIHGVQEIAFNPTVDPGDADYGNLYICLGDGSSGSKQLHDNLQTTSSFLGTIFRIDPHGNNSSNGQYGIPDDNPFYEGTGTGVVGEIYAYGFRNPHRISWDVAGTHKMLVGDIGEKNIEEINLVEPGHNYGWNKREGTFLYDKSLDRDHVFSLPSDDATYQYTYPVAQYDHDEGIAVVGGYVYRGTMLTSLYGQYVFGDIANGKLFHVPEGGLVQGSQSTISQLNLLNQSGSPTTLLEEVSHTRVDLRFGVDLNDELYILSKVDGIIRVLEPVDYVTATANMKVSKFFPNPGKGTFKVLGEHGQLTIHVYNLSGALVASVDSFNASDDVLDLSHLPSGIYTFHLLQGTTSTVQKVVLE